jgi:hypothetical protein
MTDFLALAGETPMMPTPPNVSPLGFSPVPADEFPPESGLPVPPGAPAALPLFAPLASLNSEELEPVFSEEPKRPPNAELFVELLSPLGPIPASVDAPVEPIPLRG